MRLPATPVQPRESATSSITSNFVKTLLQVTVMWGLALGLFPWAIASFERVWGLPSFASSFWRSVGLVLFLAMSALGLWCAFIFVWRGKGTPLPLDTATRLVVLGPYRVIRNPMAISGIAQGFAVGLMWGSPLTLLYSLAGAFVWNYWARPWEEADLLHRFGEPYAQYQEAVPCWIPTLSPYPKVEAEHLY